MSNKMSGPRTPRRAKGKEFKPREPYTHRLRKILEEYPDGSQVLREILQNSDDAKSTEQIFILDHNTYPSDSLFEPDLVNNYERTNLKLDRYQGPALFANNNTIFEERDFQSLLKLADSEKRDQFDKIGVMGVGFNSIYHITDSPSFITGSKYVILDPHEWYFNGGVQFDFVADNLAEDYQNQFAPFRIPCDKPYEGTIFRYPLRTDEDSIDSDISKKVYKPEEILDMFKKFYDNESINCLLFLKYVERITFYELKEGASEPELLYTIQLDNAEQVREQRRLITENIVSMMNKLQSKSLGQINQLQASYVAEFSRQQKEDCKETSSWLILNYLDDLNEAEKHFLEKFDKNIGDYKFVPNVGLAVPLNNLNVTGRLFCFLPLPIDMPFRVSVHGYFAVSTNRRSLWSAADNEDLAIDALARLKVTWNRYLFENVLPKAWVKFLCELPFKVTNIRSSDLYKFWPITKGVASSSINNFCKDLLQNVANCLKVEDRVFQGPSSLSTIGEVGNPATLYDSSSFKESEFHWLSLSNGYFENAANINLARIIGEIGFPVIIVPPDFIRILKNSQHKDSLKFFSPAVIRKYLDCNRDRWENTIPKKEVLQLFYYILKDKKFDELVGFKMIPLADGELGVITQSNDSCVYIGPDNDTVEHKNDERNIFKNQLNKFIDKSIDFSLYRRLYDNAKAGWDLNIKILDESTVAKMVKFSLNSDIADDNQNVDSNSEEIYISDRREWIYHLWENIKYRSWDLKKFEEIHIIPTSRSTLRKLKTPKKIFSSQTSTNNSIKSLISIFEKFGVVFLEYKFDIGKVSKWDRMSPYIIKPDDVISVLGSFQADTTDDSCPKYPENLNCTLQDHEASALVGYLSNYLRLANRYHLVPKLIDVIKHLPIFDQVGHTSPISLLPGNKMWYLLPQGEENSYGKIIYPIDKGGFLSTKSRDLCDILEKYIKVPRLNSNDYWRNYVIPFLDVQSPEDVDIVMSKLFDQLSHIIDPSLKDTLGRKSFVPAGTFKMSQQRQKPDNAKLVRPIDLFDPEEKSLVDLFFEDEQVFPAGNYGIPQTSLSKKFLPNLKLLGIKSILSLNDVVSRIDTITDRRQISNIPEELIRTKALKLFKYLDENWDKLITDDTQTRENRGPSNILLKAILEKEWIPTVDTSDNKVFSSLRKCRSQKDKDLTCLVTPIVEYKVKNKRLLKQLGWDTYPVVGMIIEQLGLCFKGVKNKQPHKNLVKICTAVYKYMDEIFKASDNRFNKEFNYMKDYLKDKSWILSLRDERFYPADKVIFKLPNKFRNNESLIVELPEEYFSFKSLFEAMGVRDEIGIKDFILIIKNVIKEDNDKILSTNEINNIIQILKQVAEIQKDNPENLDGLLVPSTENKLVDLKEIQFDDMGDSLSDKEKCKHKITHKLVNKDIAKELKIQNLKGKIYGNDYNGDMDWEKYEQNESLTTRIKNIIKDYSISSLFKEFLQNADDAKATRFEITVDERRIFQHNGRKYLSEEMEDWQGPAIWIYNDAEFSPKDFQALIKLGTGGKSNDETKIGRFGIGFNCAFHITDLPSFVSGKYIVFLDPNAKYLPAQDYPPRRPRGTRIDFINKEFKKSFPEQCYPYEALGCNFSEEFKGTLFRLPLRTSKTAKKSEISDQVFEIRDILQLFNRVQSNKEMLFLRNIESCSFYHMRQQTSQLIWEAQINMSNKDRGIRKSVIDSAQLYQMDIEITNNKNNKKVSEIWLLCTGGSQSNAFKQDLKEFSEKKQLKPRGGVASLLSQSDRKSFAELRAESFPNPPELKGEIYSYLSLSISTNLGVHLNGNFSLTSARSNILQSENDFLQADCDDAKWNRYILYDVLPLLHNKLLDEIVNLEEIRYNNNRTNFIPHTLNNLWPITKNLTMGLYKSYGANVIKKGNNRIYWTEANGGKFISLKEGKIIEGEETMIGDILGELGVSILKLDKDKLEQIKEIAKNKRNLGFKYETISGKEVCDKLREGKDIFINSFIQKNNNDSSRNKKDPHESIFLLLRFILRSIDGSYENLRGLPLVPLSNESVGTFGEVYYVGKQKHINLFPIIGPSKFVRVDLPHDLEKFFKRDELSVLNINQFDSASTLDLVFLEFPYKNIKELDWDPNGKSIPNDEWLKEIWSKLTSSKNIEFAKLSKLPLLPMIQPSEKLVQLDITNPLLNIEQGSYLYPVLKKLKLRFTNMKFPDNANSNLKQCVLPYNPVNIVNALERTRILLNLTMEQLFKAVDLSNKDYEKFRAYIKENHEALKRPIRNQEFLNILRSLPIWPVHSCGDKLIDAKSGILLPYNLPFFSFQQNNDFYKCDELDFRTLFGLNVTYIDEEKYIQEYFIPHHINTTPSQDYIIFLQRILSLGKREIEQYFELYPLIPNKSLTALVKANTLYDITVPLFCNVFEGSDNFLPTIFYSNMIWVTALKRIGLKYQVNCKTIIECAREIESQFQNDQYPTNVVKHRAKSVIDYLYEHTETLNFSSGQWSEIMQIKFVPSEKNFQNSLYEDAKETSGLESFAVLCFQRYKEVCWTQKPLFDKNVEPNTSFLQRRPKIGKPSPEDVMSHWSYVVDKIKSRSFVWRSSENYSVVKKIIKKIYEIMNEFSKETSGLSIDPEEKLFLNGEDPFDDENWIAGSELVFGVQEDIRKGLLHKVNECLIPYKELLLLAGALKLEEIVEDELDFNEKHDQKNLLLDSLLDKLVKNLNTKHHDVTFVVGEEELKFGASRYVLSASSKYFEKMFCGHTAESIENEQIRIRINDVNPDAFQVFLRWLYGQSFETAKNAILRKQTDFNADDEDYVSYYLSFLVDLLKITDMYEGEPLKEIVEITIIKGKYININNVCEILEWAKDCKASKLATRCERYIEKNKNLIVENRLELCETEMDDEIRREDSQMLELLLNN
ncbi:hypothetical protein RclHR1_00470007 [Rhizophagus clarus]|uniref:BTB domain-containing protein n=1 Tax=Rhizophagus clarus TaxID=94130 RepID=A0A2Z6SCC3_9GLOM|nr:hypothetical protein RclHR1_00470007 [Rhizophagus clarus]